MRVEPDKLDEFNNIKIMWHIYKDGGVDGYLEILKGLMRNCLYNSPPPGSIGEPWWEEFCSKSMRR